MIRLLIIGIFFLASTLQADYLNTKNNLCVYDIAPNFNKKGICYTERRNNKRTCNKNLKYTDLRIGYHQDGKYCKADYNLDNVGLSIEDWNFQLALLANLVGFTMLFMLSFLAVLTSRK